MKPHAKSQRRQEKRIRPGKRSPLPWLLRQPARIPPIIGTTKPERIKVACEADDVELTRDEWYRLFIAGRGEWMP